MKVPFFVPDVGDSELDSIREVIESQWITMGPGVEEFEREFASIIGVRYAVAVNSGNAALHIATLCLEVGPGDEVIVPSLTLVATANAITYTGARPVFADVNGIDDWTLSADDVQASIGPRTKAVIAMHYAGYPCEMDRLQEICDELGIRRMEDAGHGLGGSLNGRMMGGISTLGCFSFYSNKAITTAEGGMLTTDHEGHAIRARRLRSHGMTNTAIDQMRGSLSYSISEVGFNYRMDDIRAALGRVQLRRLPHFIQQRRDTVAYYRDKLGQIDGVNVPTHGMRGQPAHYILPVRLDEKIDRDALRERMSRMGIQTSMHFPPVHRFPPYESPNAHLPNTERIANVAMSLPLYPGLTREQVDFVCDVLAASI